MRGVTNCGRCIHFDEETGECEGKFRPNISAGGSCGVLRAGQVDIKWKSWDNHSPRRITLRWFK